MVTKEELWKHEDAIKVVNSRGYSGCHISLKNGIIDNKLNENHVLLYRFSKRKDVYSINKICKIERKVKNETFYVLGTQKESLRKACISFPGTVSIDIIDKKRVGWKPKIETRKGKINLISLIRGDTRFTCFERHHDWLSVYLLNKKATSVATLPRFIPIDDFSFWIMGFYLAEGLKTNLNRISVSNGKWELLSRFKDYMEKYWKVNRDSIYLYVKVKPENCNKSLESFWARVLGLNKDQIKVVKTRNKPPVSKYGQAEMVIYNTAMGTLFHRFFQKVLKLNKTKEHVLAFLKGLEAGDGHVMERGGIEIGVTCENKFVPFVKSLYGKIYDEPRIREHHTSQKVKIIFYKGLKNARLFLLDGHFEKHKERRLKLVNLLRYYLRKHVGYLEILSNRSKTTRELAEDKEVTYRAARLMLRDFIKDDFVKSMEKEICNGKRLYKTKVFYLTERGRKLLKYLT